MADQAPRFVITDANSIYEEIIRSLEYAVGEPMFPGDERRIYGEGIVQVFVQLYNRMNESTKQSLLRYAKGNVLDAIGERSGTHRLTGTKATATMRFFVSNIISTNAIIPAGTKVTPDGVLYFETVEAGIIQAGTHSADIQIEAVTSGIQYNGFVPGTIETLVDLLPYISRVTNITETVNGDDGEPYNAEGDNHYRDRIRLAPGKRSTAGPAIAYEYWAMTADSEICDVRAITPAPGEVTVVPLLFGGKIPDSNLMGRILSIVDNERIRPLTDKVRVKAPVVVPYPIRLKYYVSAITEAEVINNVEGPGGAIERYNKWQCEALGRDINPDHLRKLILAPDWGEQLIGALRVDLVKPTYTNISEIDVAVWNGSIQVTHEIMEGVF